MVDHQRGVPTVEHSSTSASRAAGGISDELAVGEGRGAGAVDSVTAQTMVSGEGHSICGEGRTTVDGTAVGTCLVTSELAAVDNEGAIAVDGAAFEVGGMTRGVTGEGAVVNGDRVSSGSVVVNGTTSANRTVIGECTVAHVDGGIVDGNRAAIALFGMQGPVVYERAI